MIRRTHKTAVRDGAILRRYRRDPLATFSDSELDAAGFALSRPHIAVVADAPRRQEIRDERARRRNRS